MRRVKKATQLRRIFSIGLLGILSALPFHSCQDQEYDPYHYYNSMIRINNDLLVQVYETLYKTRIILSNPDTLHNSDLYSVLRINYDSVMNLCGRSLEKLHETGPLESDSLLYNTYIYSLESLSSLCHNEFRLIVDHIGEQNNSPDVTNALYHASLKLAENHISVLDSLSLFIRRYQLDLDSFEISYHREKALKFIEDVTRLKSSVCLAGDCLNGFGQQEDELGNIYTGFFKNGLYHGRGKLLLANGNTYEGEFEKGLFSGKGSFEWVNGSLYHGEWRKGVFNGIGTLYLPEGDTIFGYWENGEIKKL